jgi:hypothetical protein
MGAMSSESQDWVKAAVQRAHRTETAAEVVMVAVVRAEMDRAHDALNVLLKQD